MRLVLATRNPGKVAELQARLGPLSVDLVSAADLGAPEVVEDADTLRGNARGTNFGRSWELGKSRQNPYSVNTVWGITRTARGRAWP